MATKSQTQTAIAAFALFCVSLLLTAYSIRNPETARIGSTLMGEITSPFSVSVKGISDWIYSFKKEYADLLVVREENVDLKSRVVGLEALNSQLMEERSENRRLRGLLAMKEQHALKGITARVIGVDASPWVQSVTIDRGSFEGLKPGMAVIEGHGIVGEIISVSSTSSKVLLMTDHASAIDVVVQSSRARGIIEGRGKQRATLRYILRESDVSVGDRVITSGMDGVFPKGLLIGKVSSVKKQSKGMFQVISVLPAVVFSRLEEVFVLTEKIDPDPKGLSELLAKPTPVATSTPTPIPTKTPLAKATTKPKSVEATPTVVNTPKPVEEMQ